MDKKYILDEIRRTARKNNGVALGKSRFKIETGIKDSDWFGKHWAKWSDALAEAGFTPNRLQQAYDDDALIAKFVDFVKEIKKYPARGELRLKAHNDPSFPDPKTFERRGSKTEFAAKIADYCRRHLGSEDVLRICEEEIARDKPAARTGGRDEDVEIGYVYLIKSGRFYKIGRSNSPGRREWELGLKLPEKVQTVHIIRTDDPVGIEAYWHRRFEAKRKSGEWFDLDSRDVGAFKRRKFM